MSHELIDHSEDLRRLDSAYDVHIIEPDYLVIEGVPYVKPHGELSRASLIIPLHLQGDVVTTKPATHVAYWTGEYPHRADGITPLEDSLGGGNANAIHPRLPSVIMFSANGNYESYHHKAMTYMEYMGREARKIDPSVTALRTIGNDG